jgi:hypothetical protein
MGAGAPRVARGHFFAFGPSSTSRRMASARVGWSLCLATQSSIALSAPRTTASEFLTTVNRLQISLMIRDPFVATAFRAAEDHGLAPDLITDWPRTLDGGAAELVLTMAEGCMPLDAVAH